MVFLLKHNNNSMLIKIERKKITIWFFLYEFNNFNFKDINDIYKFNKNL